MALEIPDLNNRYSLMTYGDLYGKIKRIISQIESIDLSCPTRARLLLAVACLDINALCIDLQGVSSFVKKCYSVRLFSKPRFSTLAKKISEAKDNLTSSEWYHHYWILESAALEGYEPTEIEKNTSLQAIDSVTKKEKIVIDNFKENCYHSILNMNIESEIGRMDKLFKNSTSLLLHYLSSLCDECAYLCKEIHESLVNPTQEALAVGLSLSNEFYKKNCLPDEITRFNTEREKDLDEYDEDLPERISEEIYYLQKKKNEISVSRFGGFFNIWNKNVDKKTGEVDFLAITKEFYPKRGNYTEELMSPYQLFYRLNEVYMYDYISNEIKRLRKKEKELPVEQTDSRQQITVNFDNRSITMIGEHAIYNEYSGKDE